jgi:mono/diheme cytochrome c family protein
MMSRLNKFWTTILTIIVIYLIVKFGIPAVARQVTGLPFPLPVPGALIFIYMVLTLVAMFLLVTFDDGPLNEFLRPIKRFLRGDFSKPVRAVGIVLISLAAGWYVYDNVAPKITAPLALRIQHPSSNFPKKMEDVKNPMTSPTESQIVAFIEQAKAGEVQFIEQVLPDFEAWMDETGEEDPLLAINTPAIKKFRAALEAGNVKTETARDALLDVRLFMGRALYAMNCRACHGDSVSGDGPMADGFKLRPIDFTDNGTIETIVEGYTFWRVENGGPGLPLEATPWDSAMPEWKVSLTEEERWLIIMAEYDLAEKTPRLPEKH